MVTPFLLHSIFFFSSIPLINDFFLSFSYTIFFILYHRSIGRFIFCFCGWCNINIFTIPLRQYWSSFLWTEDKTKSSLLVNGENRGRKYNANIIQAYISCWSYQIRSLIELLFLLVSFVLMLLLLMFFRICAVDWLWSCMVVVVVVDH